MNKSLSVVTALLLSGTLFGQNISVTDGWKLVGATENISDLATAFDNKCVDYVWAYKNNSWEVHSANGSSISSVTAMSSLTTADGFWIKGNDSCTVDTTQTATNTSSFSLQTAHVSGKTFTIDGNDNQGWVVFTLNSDGTGTETGFYQSGTQEYSDTIKLWGVSNNKLNITLNDNSTAYLTFNSQPANNVTGTYVGDETVNFDVSNFSDISSSFVAGKTIIVDPSYPSTLTFNENGSFSESGYNGAGQTQPYSCTGNWVELDNNQVALNCESSGTTETPTTSDTVINFGTTTLTNGMSITIFPDGITGEQETVQITSIQ